MGGFATLPLIIRLLCSLENIFNLLVFKNIDKDLKNKKIGRIRNPVMHLLRLTAEESAVIASLENRNLAIVLKCFRRGFAFVQIRRREVRNSDSQISRLECLEVLT